MPRDNSERLTTVSIRSFVDGKEEHSLLEKRRQGSPGAQRIPKGCLSCNNGWMKALEEEAFPTVERLIRGETWRLLPHEQARVTRLALNIALAGEFLHPDHVTTTQAERAHFKARHTPPADWFVFIGRDGTGATQPRFLTDVSTSILEPGFGAPKYHATFTLTMGHILIHIVSVGRGGEFRPADYGRILNIAPIWPCLGRADVGALPTFSLAEIAAMRDYLPNEDRKAKGIGAGAADGHLLASISSST